MRTGYILLHRQGLTPEDWEHPLRTLAWIDLLTLATWQDFTNDQGLELKRGEMIASESFLAARWSQNRGTVHRWLVYWEKEQMVQRVTQHPSQQQPQRLFIVNYAKYQGVPQEGTQQVLQRVSQIREEESKKENNNKPIEYMSDVVDPMEMEFRQFVPIASHCLKQEKTYSPKALSKWVVRRKKWSALEIQQAFENLANEPDQWKINNNGFRPLAWWLASDERIEEMLNCHLKRSSTPKVRFIS